MNANFLGKVYLERESGDFQELSSAYGFFKNENVAKFTSLTKTYTCNFKDGELKAPEEDGREEKIASQ